VQYSAADVLQGFTVRIIIIVTDGVEGMCVDPGKMGAILEARVVGGPGLPGGGQGGQLASDSGGR
jgi:hypothetical protein